MSSTMTNAFSETLAKRIKSTAKTPEDAAQIARESKAKEKKRKEGGDPCPTQ